MELNGNADEFFNSLYHRLNMILSAKEFIRHIKTLSNIVLKNINIFE